MTITNNVVAKFSVAFVTVAMALTFSAPAHAQSTEAELQALIDSLTAQIAALTSQVGAGGGAVSSASGVCPYNWTRTLNMGATGDDVMKLQQFLNADPLTRVAASGVGSAGQETQYYGGLTGAAVAKFQEANRAAILSPLGLVNSTTFFGNSTRAEANRQCASAPAPVDDVMDDADDADDSSDDDANDDDDGPLSGGESSLENFNAKSGDDTELEEGQEDAPVMDVEFDVEDGDIAVKRMDVAVDHQSGTETNPWDVFDEISLWVDGDKVADAAADDEDDWEEDTPNSGDYRMRIAGLDEVFRENEEANITVGVTLQGSIDGNTGSWDFFIPDNGVRGRDGEGVDQFTGDTADTVNVDFGAEGNDDELKVQSSSNDPDATTIAVDADDKSGFETVFIFDLDTDDSVNDIEVDGLVVNVVVPGDVFNDVVDDAQLLVNGNVYDDWSFVSGTGATATSSLDFDTRDEDFIIEAGEEVEVEFQLEFNSQSGNYAEGQEIFASTTSDDLDADGADDLAGSQLSGSATGETHSLRTEGVIVEPGDHDFNTQGTNDDTGIFTIEFDVEAFENDAYIAKNATTSGTNTDGGVDFTVTGPGGATLTVSGALSSTADEDTADVFTVREGETETFTLTVTVDTDTTGLHSVELNDIWFTSNSDGVTSLETDPASPATDYRVVDENINA